MVHHHQQEGCSGRCRFSAVTPLSCKGQPRGGGGVRLSSAMSMCVHFLLRLSLWRSRGGTGRLLSKSGFYVLKGRQHKYVKSSRDCTPRRPHLLPAREEARFVLWVPFPFPPPPPRSARRGVALSGGGELLPTTQEARTPNP